MSCHSKPLLLTATQPYSENHKVSTALMEVDKSLLIKYRKVASWLLSEIQTTETPEEIRRISSELNNKFNLLTQGMEADFRESAAVKKLFRLIENACLNQ
ncbi:hypothetical protein ACH7BS_24475 [Klebsiella aerogenes]|uniref:hypothetical protein n=1 Tax=Klebsiella aerogenes TaxID=548 RepID=UPI0037A6C2F6